VLKTILAAASFAACAAIVSSGATAAPVNAKNATPILIVCPSGSYQAVVNGKGNFTAAHAVDSNTVLIPIAFGPFTTTFTDPDGVITTNVEPGSAKGNSVPANGKIQDCMYSISFSFTDGSSFFGSGSVTGFIPGH
jgi:hypothetical protein